MIKGEIMYKEFGWTEEVMQSTDYIYPCLIKLLDKEKNKCILDVGCGNGDIANKLIAEGYCVYGVDASHEGICIANKTNQGHFFLADLQTEMIPKEIANISFDTVISTEVIEHMYSPEAYINFIDKIFSFNTEKVGHLYLTTPYHGYLKNLLLALLNKVDNHVNPLFEGGHIKFFSKKTLTILLTKHKYKNIRYYGCGRFPYLWKSILVDANICSEKIYE